MLAKVCRKKTPGAISSTCPVGFQKRAGSTPPDQNPSARSRMAPIIPPGRLEPGSRRMGPAQPAQRAGQAGLVLDRELDPAASREAAVRPRARLAERARLVVGGQSDPQVAVFVAQREAGEDPVAGEVAPPAEHGRDAHARPAAERHVQRAGGARPAAFERPPRFAGAADAAHAPPALPHRRILPLTASVRPCEMRRRDSLAQEIRMVQHARFRYEAVEGADTLFTPSFVDYLLALHDALTPRIQALMTRRAEALQRALMQSALPAHPPPSLANTGDWKVPAVPADLLKPGIEISGPCSITSMFINALNPGPEGERAEGDLDDDEDSGGHRLVDTVRAAHNRVAAVHRELHHVDPERKKEYRIAPGELPFFMHRERGIHLSEPELTVDGQPVNAALLGTALTLFHAGRAQAERGQGIYFYLPKLEFAPEARLYRDLFDVSRERLPWLRDAVIRAIVLVEALPCVYEMEEMLYALGPYAAGLNAARWDLKASIFEYVMADPGAVWPDRFGVDIKTTAFLSNIFRRLVAICVKRGAVPIGGMATALPNPDPEVNRVAGDAIRADKEWEAPQGFLRAWVAHIFHMKTAADPFTKHWAAGFKPTPDMAHLDRYPVRIE